MAYLALNRDGSTTELGSITGYRVQYTKNGQKRQSRPFPFMWQALGFQKGLRMGQSSTIVPVYSNRK